MVRPVSRVSPAGGSPVPVSAGAPGSRPRAAGEIPTPERGIESPYVTARSKEGSGAAGPMHRRELLQPRDIDNRKGGVAEPVISGRRQQTASGVAGGMQDAPGVG